ncbi:MAG: sodium:proton symporter [Acidobacteria bacterium RIFCSPLOWO2_12_FULL_65_11]|nr:MAG: sodium:proton symporter [Acidobacteria bacterium RIFCSPLOWO2_02_FULL_64_15]OFW33951.1 MAG: sodium:proton symporter [Acidobacteria bacterium RIFCSPLOWO2_12_FULL_65_11]
MKLHTKLFIALVLGAALGAALHSRADVAWIAAVNVNLLRPIGQLFLRSIFMIVVPMVFSALVVGVYELGKGHELAGVAGRTLLFTVVMSALSVLIGIALVNTIRPGDRLGLSLQSSGTGAAAVQTLAANAAAAKPIGDAIVEIVPRNPLDSAVRALDGEMLPLMVFAVVFGIAVSATSKSAGGRNVLMRLLEQIFDACMRIVHVVMQFSPVAVFAIIFNTAFTLGTGVFASLFLYVLTVIVGLLLQQFGVYSALLRIAARRSPIEFFRNCREVYLYAFSTASSNATLPLALEVADTKLRLPPDIARFVLTVGSTANQNGTALFEGITVLFLAQVYGLDLGAGQQLRVMLMSILAGVGTAGVPGGSLPMVLIVAQSVGVPAEGMGLILGVDRLLDMCRTTVNVSGDLVIAALVSGPPKP